MHLIEPIVAVSREEAVYACSARRVFTAYMAVLNVLKARKVFNRFVADAPADGVTSNVVILQADEDGGIRGGQFGDLCRSQDVKQEFIAVYGPQHYGVVDHALGLTDSVAMAGRMQSRGLFPGAKFSATQLL